MQIHTKQTNTGILYFMFLAPVVVEVVIEVVVLVVVLVEVVVVVVLVVGVAGIGGMPSTN